MQSMKTVLIEVGAVVVMLLLPDLKLLRTRWGVKCTVVGLCAFTDVSRKQRLILRIGVPQIVALG